MLKYRHRLIFLKLDKNLSTGRSIGICIISVTDFDCAENGGLL
jgi:hypothetical protein